MSVSTGTGKEGDLAAVLAGALDEFAVAEALEEALAEVPSALAAVLVEVADAPDKSGAAGRPALARRLLELAMIAIQLLHCKCFATRLASVVLSEVPLSQAERGGKLRLRTELRRAQPREMCLHVRILSLPSFSRCLIPAEIGRRARVRRLRWRRLRLDDIWLPRSR